MADPVADNADFAVDELKRKARRRLVGAIVIALAAATLLPMLLEQEQKPLGEDVSVQIPAVDGGKFVSRLKGDKARDAGDKAREAPPAARAEDAVKAVDGAGSALAPTPAVPAAVVADAAPAAVAAAAPAEPAPTPVPATPVPAVKAAAPDARADAKAPAPAAVKPPPVERAREPKPEAASAPPPNPALTSAATLGSAGQDAAQASAPAATAVAAATAAEAPRAGAYVVQLGAFTDNYGANALAGKLKKSGYPAYTEPVETGRATLWRVRVGGYPTRQAAGEARARLKADGHNGVVTAAK